MTTTVPGQTSAAPSVVALGWRRTRFETITFLREPTAVVFTLLFPVMLLLLFCTIFSGTIEGTDVDFRQYLVAGICASGVLTASFALLAQGIAVDRGDGTLKRLAGTPLPVTAWFLGKVGLVLWCVVVETALVLGIGALLFGLSMPTDPWLWGYFALVTVLGTAGCSLVGIAFSSLARNPRSAAAIVQPPLIALQFISGVWLRFDLLPSGLRFVARLFPLAWMAQGYRSVFLPDSFKLVEPAGEWQRGLGLAVLAAWCVAGFVLCRLTFRWLDRR